jgi:hypothetical protein
MMVVARGFAIFRATLRRLGKKASRTIKTKGTQPQLRWRGSRKQLSIRQLGGT